MAIALLKILIGIMGIPIFPNPAVNFTHTIWIVLIYTSWPPYCPGGADQQPTVFARRDAPNSPIPSKLLKGYCV
jgi:hypothetical protein